MAVCNSRRKSLAACAAAFIQAATSFTGTGLQLTRPPSLPVGPPPPKLCKRTTSPLSVPRLFLSPSGDDLDVGIDWGDDGLPARPTKRHPKRRRRREQRQGEALRREKLRRGAESSARPSSPLSDGRSTPTAEDGDAAAETELPRPIPDPQLEDAIDSFLRGEYDRPFAEDAAAPHPGLGPGVTVEAALRSLRDLDDPEPSHGAAVFLRFCAPLSRGDRWGGGDAASDPWKEVLRGAITPTMLARRLRASQFSGLLDWERLDVTEGLSVPTTRERLGVGTTVAFVNAAMFFGDGVEPSIVQFTLRKIGGVWLVDTAVISKKEWFIGDRS